MASEQRKETGQALYHFRLQCIGMKAAEFAPALLARLTEEEPRSRLAKEIYEDDGRGTIRDFLLSEHRAGDFLLEVIHVRSSDEVVNFRLREGSQEPLGSDEVRDAGIECRQRPWPPGQPYRLIGEGTPWYFLRAPKDQAELLLEFLVREVERCGMNGYLTREERELNPVRLRLIREDKDPHLVVHRYRAIEYEKGREAALCYLDVMIDEVQEFSPYLRDLRKKLVKPSPSA